MKIIAIIVVFVFYFTQIFPQGNKILLDKTIITPHLQTKIFNDTNIVYCSTFQIVWNELKKKVGGNVILSENIKLGNYLNEDNKAEKYVNENSYYVFSGVATENYIRKINKEIKSRFKGIFDPVDDKPSTDEFLIYSFLYKKLKFIKDFEDYKNGISFNKNKDISKKIKAFGINFFNCFENNSSTKKREKILKQIDLYILPEKINEFVVKINTKGDGEEIILAKISPKINLNETILNVLELSKNMQSAVQYKICELAIPEIDFDIDYTYKELINKKILNKGFEFPQIIEAQQSIIFKLDKKGAVLKSKAKMKLGRGGSIVSEACKRLIFDEPFLLLLKEKNKDFPYFAIWISNDKLLKYINK